MVTSTNGVTGSTGTGSTSGSSTAQTASTFENSDYQTFLKMLTAQIQNQDPLNPMESTDFAVQLATFSGVEQQVRTNQLLEKMVSQATSTTTLAELSSWIGKEVKTTAPVPFDQTNPLTLDIAPAAAADSAVLVTRDRYGREVSREALSTGSGQVAWLGQDAKGNPLAKGLYYFTLESYTGSTMIAESNVPTYARVAEAELTSSGPVLLFAGGGSTPASTVTSIRN